MRLHAFLPALALLAFASFAPAQLDDKTVDRIVDEGKNRNEVMRHLTHITTKIGPRLTGSQNLDKAMSWAMGQFKKMGLKNVRFERYGEMQGFDRGPKMTARMVAPIRRELEFTANAWTVGTDGPVVGPAILAPTNLEELGMVRDRLKGAWIVYREKIGRRDPSAAPDEEIEALLDRAGIAGRVRATESERLSTNGRPGRPGPDSPKTPSILIRGSDHSAILDFLSIRTDVQLEFQLDHRFADTDRPIGNVIAEIPGTKHPDEFVLVSGHLDSWDGPGTQGCQDNGTGSSIVLEVARILSKVGAKPDRTIRFVLWSGEEQGLLGSSGYVRMHEAELPKTSAVFVEDAGGGYDAGLAFTEKQAPVFRPVLARIAKEFPDRVPQERILQAMPTRGGGSDHAPFVAKGVPGFFWRKGGAISYSLIWHTQYDRLELVEPLNLIQSSTCNALTAMAVACAPTLLPRD